MSLDDHADPGAPAAGDADLSVIGAALADRGRCRILLALADGRSLPASVLAGEAGVSASTASAHLSKLCDAGLLQVFTKGRFRYYRLAGDEVGRLIETLARLSPSQPIRSLREGTRAHAIRLARCCYDHIAGRLGVAITDAMIDREYLSGHDGSVDLDRLHGDRLAGGLLDDVVYRLTAAGRSALAELGVVLPAADTVRCCVDWTEQRHHVAGPLGRALLDALTTARWLRRADHSRALRVTDTGRNGLRDHLGLPWPPSVRSGQEPAARDHGGRAPQAATRRPPSAVLTTRA
ncbi:ArsR/SmtB family transcription factor [Pseudonocardia acidicola]|uniref:Helix-turn-helix transcriptional regulator n=1 Tax=Pseudonocardia acidicola TaxID=2724939 RepID=A0ABX1SK12_9PSEU|nr:metalloregulator ArsR/SmtB family transcription factor [Pseudonocardia acidicola]NMI01919.1 helix-turn-helix transcriptional regulator [Pseudonocardia acidicola]